MLIQFTLKNFMSFRQEATLDLRAISAYATHSYNLMPLSKGEHLLRVAAIYGANASGKSNIFAALATFQRIVIESFNNVAYQEQLPIAQLYHPFEFDEQGENTEFEILLAEGGTEYHYGFEYNDTRIVAEWLYARALDSEDKIMLLERSEHIAFGSALAEECALYQDQIPDETLALTFLSRLRLRSAVFRELYQSITGISVITSRSYRETELERLLPDLIDASKAELTTFLSSIDTGIKDIYYKERGGRKEFFTLHHDAQGRAYPLSLYSESEGTIKSIIVFALVQSAIRSHRTVLIDELNAQLHPLLLKFIIDLFYAPHSCSQLIYTTHDTTLLAERYFRRDQIFFVEKDASGQSALLSLAEFQQGANGDYSANYLAGVYGAIPQLRDFVIQGASHE